MDTSTPVDLRFRTVLARLQATGRIRRVDRKLSVDDEVAAVLKHHDDGDALVCTAVTGHSVPVLGNLLASEANCEAAFGTDRHGIRELVARAMSDSIAPEIVPTGPARDHVFTSTLDLGSRMPVLRHAPGDAGRFVTAGVVIARHPVTGVHNASYHRLQLVGDDRVAIKLDLGRHLRAAFESAQSLGRPLPIAVALGTDISLLYTAATMGSQMPESRDELAAAGALQGSPLRMLTGLTQDVLVPADAEFVLEGAISATETVPEGPFGEFVGYQSDAGPAPVVQVTALSHRRNPVYHAINGAGRETVMLRKYVLETSVLTVLRDTAPMVVDVNMTAGGLHRFHLNLAVHKDGPQHDGFEVNAALAAFGALKDLVRVVVVDDDIDIHDERDVEYAIATRCDPARDLVVVPRGRGHEYLRLSDRGIVSKWLVNATVPYADRERFRRVPFAPSTVSTADLLPCDLFDAGPDT
ncbi:UbiD family decarboxylase [Plantactinospora mayteni]|uniref:UbiD family decarboxylase n=1 Tax=Plantactinospora mayteni TaxID=566021 RepID=A0ABQ4ERD3_9ACTN|nr:UbiD family decarboxylase [Plantactinospora mayteni]GIG97196.1 hypothetical protein Pma05_37690 [Plantactinospora mayteni]